MIRRTDWLSHEPRRASGSVMLSWTAAATVLALLVSAPALAADAVAVFADRVLRADGTLGPAGGVLVRDGRVERVLGGDEAEGLRDRGVDVVRFGPGSVLSPGLIDAGSWLGAVGNTGTRTEPVTPGLEALSAMDATDPALRAAASAGVTTAAVLPGLTRVVAGSASIVKTAGHEAGAPRVVEADGPLVFSFSETALNPTREPTSRAGAVDLVRRSLRGSAWADDLRSGRRLALAVCGTAADVDAAIRTFAEFDITPRIAHSEDAALLAADLAAERTPVIVGPYSTSTSDRELAGISALAAEDATVVLAGALPMTEPDGLRFGASIAARCGLPPAAARRAITSAAADALGVAGRVGSIAPGLDADLVVFSGDPLDPGAATLAVWIDGKLVAGGVPTAADPASNDGARDPDRLYIGGSAVEQQHQRQAGGGM